MRLGLLFFGLMAAATAAALAISMGAGMTGAILAYGTSAVVAVLGGALYQTRAREPDRHDLWIRAPVTTADPRGPGVPVRARLATRPGPAPAPARDPGWWGAA